MSAAHGNGLAARRALQLCVALPSCLPKGAAEDPCQTLVQPPVIHMDSQTDAGEEGAVFIMPCADPQGCGHQSQQGACGHWQARCRGCGQLTGHEYALGQSMEGVPFCRTCSSQLSDLPHPIRSKLEEQLQWLHSKWCAAGL
jgi:hypothetical protein